MHAKRLIVVAAAALVLTTVVGLTGARAANLMQSQPTAVAVIDSDKVLNQLKERLQIQADLQERSNQLQAEKQEREKQIAGLRADLDLLQPGSQAWTEKNLEIRKALIELDSWSKIETYTLQQESQMLSQKLVREMIEVVGRVADESGFDLVIDQKQQVPVQNQQGQSSRATMQIVLWHSDAVDLTDRVIQRMNNEFEAGAR